MQLTETTKYTNLPPPLTKRKKQKLQIGMDHITHEEKKTTKLHQKSRNYIKKSFEAVESGATKAKSISQRRRWRSRKEAAEDEDDDEEERRRKKERRSVFERPQLRGHNYWPFISYHVALC
jgi:hypothetical protein